MCELFGFLIYEDSKNSFMVRGDLSPLTDIFYLLRKFKIIKRKLDSFVYELVT